MKLPSLKSLRLLSVGLLSVFIATQSSQAALTANSGDIFLAFRSDNVADTNSLIVNLGNQSLFSATGTSVLNVNPTTASGLLADLNATFAGWATRSDVHWGLFGTINNANSYIFGSKQATAGTLTSAYTLPGSTATVNAVSSNISAVINDFKTGTGTANNSAIAYLQANSTAASSYAGELTTAGKPAFGIGSSAASNWTPSLFEGNFGSGTSGTALDLFRTQFTTGSLNLGQFTINSSAGITFTPAAVVSSVPEPSRALLSLIGFGSLLLRRQRRLLPKA